MNETADSSDLRYQALIRQVQQDQLIAFAQAAERVLLAGEAYLAGCAEGVNLLQMEVDTGLPQRQLKRAGVLATSYGETDAEELVSAAFLAASRKGLNMEAVNRGLCGPSSRCPAAAGNVLRILVTTGVFARALVERRRMTDEGEPPQLEHVAYHLAGHWGEVIYKDTWPAMAGDLASAFPAGRLPVKQAEDIVARFGMQMLTPELCKRMAMEAIKTVQNGGAGVTSKRGVRGITQRSSPKNSRRRLDHNSTLYT